MDKYDGTRGMGTHHKNHPRVERGAKASSDAVQRHKRIGKIRIGKDHEELEKSQKQKTESI